jgi:hypothetical protein
MYFVTLAARVLLTAAAPCLLVGAGLREKCSFIHGDRHWQLQNQRHTEAKDTRKPGAECDG